MTDQSRAPHREQVPSTEDPEHLVSRVEGRLDELAQRFDKTDWIELLAAVILALATVTAAWSAYQSTRWGGNQAKAQSRAVALRTDAAQATTLAAQGLEIDSEFLTSWITLAAEGNESGKAALEERIRDEFRPAFDAWVALVPDGQIPPGTPFELTEYTFYAGETRTQALELHKLADKATLDAARDNQLGDNFVLVAVIMASVLFFAGVGAKFRGRATRILMIFLAVVFFSGGLAFMLSLPQDVGI
jgi:hypothetical protein